MANDTPTRRKLNNSITADKTEIEAPDGGYGWIVVFSSFCIHIITDGITYSFGVLFIQLLDEFKEGKGYTSWILSLMCGITLCSGPISSLFVNKYGCRAVTIVGAILASACLFISAYAQNVLTLIITIGFGVGCGLGLIYLPAIVSVAMYFKKYRSLATGIAVAGSGLGTSIFSPLIAFFAEAYGWRYSVLLLAAIVLNNAIFGALFRPLTASSQQTAPTEYSDAYQRDDICEMEPVLNNHHHSNGKSINNGVLIDKNKENDNRSLKESQKLIPCNGALSRPDIFYRGSLPNIPNSRSPSELSINRYGSIRHIEEFEDLSSSGFRCGCIPVDAYKNLVQMTNFSLLKNPVYILFIASNVATTLGFYIPYFYLPDRAKELGVSEENVGYMIATIGIANTFGRIILGYISDNSYKRRLWVYKICLFSCGIATAASVLCMDLPSLIIYSAVFGFTIGAYVGLTSVILVDLIGLDKLTNGFGLLLLFQGIASFIGPPIVGMLYDQFKTYTPGFVLAGSLISFSSFLVLFIPRLQNHVANSYLRFENEQP
ncbi:monocarboxylate transporter 12-like [Sitodiplosis mosellana]|uniref:monocarboxylate transporter 12-like n=1 Tax=Sitodiplosis mosellana TaxID=263140 RepID=UPI002444F028|nr:monocarboxylate transporter 12-like [Sitodiplosis mosellana]